MNDDSNNKMKGKTMTTTQSKIGSLSILLTSMLVVSATSGFGHPNGPKTIANEHSRSIRLVGLVSQLNRDDTFELVTTDGQRYTVHMAKDARVDAYAPGPNDKRLLSFTDLYRGARLSITAEPAEQTYASTANPIPVSIR